MNISRSVEIFDPQKKGTFRIKLAMPSLPIFDDPRLDHPFFFFTYTFFKLEIIFFTKQLFNLLF